MSQPTLEQLEQLVTVELAAGRFSGTAKVNFHSETPCFKAGIDTASLSQITISINPEYEEEHPNKTEPTVKDLARHENNHKVRDGFSGCPRTLELHEQIINPISAVLLSQGFNPNDVHYLANSLEDTILHTDLHKTFSLDGMTNFFEDVREHTPEQKYTPLYEAYIRLNLYLWGNKQQKQTLGRFFPKHDSKNKAVEVLQEFLQKSKLSDLKQEYEGKQIKDRLQLRTYLNDEKNWPELARVYAETFVKLMEPGYALPIFSHSGKGTTGRENESKPASGNPIKRKGAKGKDNKKDDFFSPTPEEGNLFDKAMYSPEFKKQRAKKAYSSNEPAPAWMTGYEVLDYLYESEAQKLNLRVETFTEQRAMPIVHYGKREFNPDRDNFKHIIIGLDDKGQMALQKKRYHQDLPLNFKINPQGFPEVRFCLLDTSESMMHSPNCSGGCGGSCLGKTSLIPWGDESKYHFALLGWYGLLEYLKENHLLNQTGIGLGNFSTQTNYAQGLIEAKKLALRPQFGSTNLDLDKLKPAFNGSNMLIFTLSDGEIANWGDIKDNFLTLAKKHHYFHLQIGSETTTSAELEENGLKVVYVNGKEDFRKMIDLTDNLYRRDSK